MKTRFLISLLSAAMLISGCDGIATLLQTPTQPPEIIATEIPESISLASPTPRAPDNLIIWVDPIFAPDPETESGLLLLDRIDGFEAQNPGITVSIRVKARSGQAGMLETLSNASVAAPNLTPDLITLNPDLLQLAHIRSLIRSLEGLHDAPVSPDWYSFAVEASLVESSFVSVPIGAEGHAFVYRMDRYTGKPNDWADILNGSAPVVFPAADSQSSMTLSIYEAAGGNFHDAENNPALHPQVLTEVLSLYAGARASGLVSSASRELTNSAESWKLFHEGRAGIALAPLTSYLNERNPETEAMIPIPVGSTTSLTIAETWGWSLAADDSSREALAAELLAWVSDPEFTGPWTESIGLLPASRMALETWEDSSRISLANLLIPSVRAILPAETRDVFGPAVQTAVLSVLDGSTTADIAAQDALLAVQDQ